MMYNNVNVTTDRKIRISRYSMIMIDRYLKMLGEHDKLTAQSGPALLTAKTVRTIGRTLQYAGREYRRTLGGYDPLNAKNLYKLSVDETSYALISTGKELLKACGLIPDTTVIRF